MQPYICLNRTMAIIMTADPVMSPMTADNMIKTSVRITSACEYSLHVAQLGIQSPDSCSRKKSCRHGNCSVKVEFWRETMESHSSQLLLLMVTVCGTYTISSTVHQNYRQTTCTWAQRECVDTTMHSRQTKFCSSLNINCKPPQRSKRVQMWIIASL